MRGSLCDLCTSWKCLAHGCLNTDFLGIDIKPSCMSVYYIMVCRLLRSARCRRRTRSSFDRLSSCSLIVLHVVREYFPNSARETRPVRHSLHFPLNATRTRPPWLFNMRLLFFSSFLVRLTFLRVSTSHQKVVLEIDFSGALWVRCPHRHPSTSIAHRSNLTLGIH